MAEKRRQAEPPVRRPAENVFRRSKLRMPVVSEHYVRRQRLHSLLDEVTGAPLTLVVAPAGAGKTSLLAGWMTEVPARR